MGSYNNIRSSYVLINVVSLCLEQIGEDREESFNGEFDRKRVILA